MTPTAAVTVDAALICKQSTRPQPSAQKDVDAIATAARRLKEKHGNIGWIRKEL